jgi:hypothetical protein
MLRLALIRFRTGQRVEVVIAGDMISLLYSSISIKLWDNAIVAEVMV